MSKKSTAPTPGGAPGTRRKRGDSPVTPPTLSAEPSENKRVDVIWDEALESLRIKESEWDQKPDSSPLVPDDMKQPLIAKIAVRKRKQQVEGVDNVNDSYGSAQFGAQSRKKIVVVKVAPEKSKVVELLNDTAMVKQKEHTIIPQQRVISGYTQRSHTYDEMVQSSIVHHERRMLERHLVQEHLMNKTSRQQNELIMNVETREKEFERDIIDRLLPLAEMKGFGYWKGAEFWRQNQWIGGEERGIFDTPGQAQRGFPAPVERANIADAIRAELGLPSVGPAVPSGIEERFRGLKRGYGLGGDLEPHTPDLRELVILPHRQMLTEAGLEAGGIVPNSVKISRDSPRVVPDTAAELLSRFPDVVAPTPVPGPALRVNDQLLKPAVKSEVANLQTVPEQHETRVVFECMAGGNPCRNTVEIANVGTTVIFYSWRRLPVEDNFKNWSTKPVLSMLAANVFETYEDVTKIPPIPPVETQRFYFDTTDGALLPGAKICLPVVFKSALAGVFSERWLFTPTPPSMPAIVVNLRGAAEQPDIHAAARAQLTAELSQREAESVCRTLVRSLVDGVRTPPRPSTPVGAPGRHQKGLAFRQQNADIYFDWQRTADLEQLWNSASQIRSGPHPDIDEPIETQAEEAQGLPEWDLSVDSLYRTMVDPAEEGELDEEGMEQLLVQLNDSLAQLGFSDIASQCDQNGTAGRILMVAAADSVAEHALGLRQALGLPLPPDIPQQPPRPSSGTQQGTSTATAGRGPSTGQGKATSFRGSASKQSRGGQTGSLPQTAETPPPNTASSADLGIIRTPSDLTTADASQAIVVAKYVDKLQTTSRRRIKEIVNSLVDNVADMSERKPNITN